MKKNTLYILLLVSGLLTACYPGEDEYGFEMEVTTNKVMNSDIGLFGVKLGGNYWLTSGSAEISEVGFCWKKDAYDVPTVEDNILKAEDTSGKFAAELTGLNSSSSYTVRSYVKVNGAYVYGDPQKFQAFSTDRYLPSVKDVNVLSVRQNSAQLSAKVTSDAAYPITDAGFEYSMSSYSNAIYTRVKGIYEDGLVTLNLTGLTPLTTYYIRVYAVNKIGETMNTYSTANFTTKEAEPTISKVTVTNIVLTTADMSAEVTPYDALHPITEAGFQYYASTYPSNVSYGSNAKGNLVGNRVSLTSSDLTSGTTYQVRAYTKTSIGLSFGETFSFKTYSEGDLLKVVCNDYSILQDNGTYVTGIKLNAFVQSKNTLFPITGVGFLYMPFNYAYNSLDFNTTGATSKACTLSDNEFSVDVSNMSSQYNYYLVRAYAFSGKQIIYNSETIKVSTRVIDYSPKLGPFSCTLTPETTEVKAQLLCKVLLSYGIPVTEYGFVCSTSSDPTVGSNEQIVKLTSGSFEGAIIVSRPNTGTKRCYVRAYAKNKYGISYSENKSIEVKWRDD